MDSDKLRHTIRAEDENIRLLFDKLQRTVFDIMNGDLLPEAMRERMSEWEEIKKRLNAHGVNAYLSLREPVLVAFPASATNNENDPLNCVPDENPQ